MKKLFLLIISTIQIDALRLPDYMDELDRYNWNHCAYSGALCDLQNENPCCNPVDKCTFKEWNNFIFLYQCSKQVQIGDDCKNDFDCLRLDYAICRNKQCKCIDNFTVSKSLECVPLLGGHCSNSNNCVVKNAICDDRYKCRCRSFYKSISNDKCELLNIDLNLSLKSENEDSLSLDCLINRQGCCNPHVSNPCYSNSDKCERIKWGSYRGVFACIKPVKLGDSCEDNFNCVNVRYSQCNKRKKCDCMDDYAMLSPSKCLAPLGGNCQNEEDCLINHSTCYNYRCTCKPYFVMTSRNQCESTTLGRTCEVDLDCKDPGHVQCTADKICACKPHHTVEKNAMCAPLLNGFCETNERCNPRDSECVDNKCQCKSGFISLSHTKCIRSPLGQTCKVNSDCTYMVNAICSEDKKCVCRMNSIVINNSTCMPKLGGFCSRDKECTVNNSICIDNKCQCKSQFLYLSNDECIINKLGKHCWVNSDCDDVNKKLECSEDNKCVCTNNFVVANNTCIPKLNGICRVNDECHIENTLCIDNKCQCKLGYMSTKNNECIVAMLGESCETDFDCNDLNHSKCSEKKKCICRPFHYPKRFSCLTFLRGFCENDAKCGVDNSICIDNMCQCKDKYIIESIFECVPTPLGQKCSIDDDCEKALYAECSRGTCVCKVNTIMKNNSLCEPLIGGLCRDNESCKITNSVCVDNMCQCKVGFVNLTKHQCLPTTLEKSCIDSFDCNNIWHEKCSDKKKCVCKENHIIVNNASCAPLLGEICMSGDLCGPQNSACVAYGCQCLPTYERVSNNYCKPSRLGNQCITDYHCVDLGHLKCSEDHKCVCAEHHIIINEATCIPLLSGFCMNDNSCLIGNSACIDNACQCKDQYIAISDDQCVSNIYE